LPHRRARHAHAELDAVNVDGFAQLLTDYCLDVQPGQQIAIASSTLAAPLLLALQREVLGRGAWPLLDVTLPGQSEAFWRAVSDEQLDTVPSADVAAMREFDATLRIEATGNANALASVDPARMARWARAQAPLRQIRMTKRWAITLWPTPAAAQQAGMGTFELEEFVERALFLDRDDPVAAWGELRDFQAGLIERLAPAREIHIEGPGTDLRLNVEGRTWINSDGKRNMPSGEVFTGPHETSAEGRIRYTIPSSPRGTLVSGIELEFRAGEVVAASAERGDDVLQSALGTDPGARRLGEIGIGTNFGLDRAVGNILLDEKIGGTVHLAVGRSYPETGGINESAVHWDMICDLRRGGRLTADGEPVVQDGRLAV
jgi:aminopeptidase